MKTTENAFSFYSRLHLIELTGLRAATVQELLDQLYDISGACIYHHTHHFIQQHQYLSPEPPNDFAYWVSEVLGDKTLGERLASIDIMSHSSIRAIRDAIIETLEAALKEIPRLHQLTAPEGKEFVFLKSVSFVFPTEHRASSLAEFADALRSISLDSIYFHMFEARLRLERQTNDFSYWLSTALGEKELAAKIAGLDPYTLTAERLRMKIVRLADDELHKRKAAHAEPQ